MAEDTVLNAPKALHAAEFFKDGSPRVVRVACWSDGMVTSCVVERGSEEVECCHTAERGGEELYYAWQAHLTSPEVGYKVRPMEVESASPSGGLDQLVKELSDVVTRELEAL